MHVKRDGQWLIDRVSEVEVSPPPPSNYEHLKELEWMVGKWVDQDEEATVHTECDWTKTPELSDAIVCPGGGRLDRNVRHANYRVGSGREANPLLGV